MLDRNEMILRDERRQVMVPYMAPRPQAFAPPPEPEEPSLLASIFRHRWIVVLVTVVFVLAACVYLKKTEPLYSAHSDILIETNTPVIGNGEGMTPNQGGGNYLPTQCTLMKSSSILSLVAERPEVARLRVFRGGVNPVAYIHDRLEAEVGKKDDIISVTISTPNPQDSAVIVNAVVDAYVRYETINKNTNFSGALKALEPELLKDESDITTKEAALDDIRRKNPNVQFLADGQANAPAIIRMNAAAAYYSQRQLERANAQIIYGSSSPQLRILTAQEEEAYKQFQDAQKSAMDLNTVAADYTKLKSDVEQLRETARPLRDHVNQLKLNQDLFHNIANISVLEYGVAADQPSFPQKTRTLALAVVLGMVCGGFFAFLRDRTDGRLRTAEEIQNALGLPILGVVPRMPGRRTAVARAMAVHLDPRSEVAEAYRTIRTAVYFGARGTRSRTLLVTSPEAGDGKTTSASNLAIAIAQTGRSVLLLDADFRKPTQHKNLDVKDSVGLSSVLSGTETLDRAIQRTGVDGLDILPCGTIPGNPSEILNSQEFGELVDRLALKYDHIIFDSPPVNLVTDARILGAVCDATVLVLRADKSTRKAAEHARNALLSVGAKVLGAVVNDVPRGKGYETYGGSYYGTADMRSPGDHYSSANGSADPGASNGYLSRLPRSTADVTD